MLQFVKKALFILLLVTFIFSVHPTNAPAGPGGPGGPGGPPEVDPVFTASPAVGIAAADIVNWNAAESDPIFAASPASGIAAADIINWDAAENDPVFAASPASGIVAADIVNWNAAQDIFPTGGIIMWSGLNGAIPAGWQLCDGSGPTPDLRDRFIVGSGGSHGIDTTGGATTHNHGGNTQFHTLTIAEMPSHNHGVQINDATSTGPTRKPETAGITNTKAWPSDFTGGDGGHRHGINSDNNIPPYYALAYIMKL